MNTTPSIFRVAGILVVMLIGMAASARQQDEPADAFGMTGLPMDKQPAGDQPAWSPAQPPRELEVSEPAAPQPSLVGTDEAKGEPVVERYRNERIKIQRHVIQDKAGNYINHGTYTEYDPDGKIIKTGEYRNGKQQGKWSQRFAKNEGCLFSGVQENGFQGPFLSEATFLDGQLHGTWTVNDRNGQKLIEWNFDRGGSTGKWTWWYLNGQKRLEATYQNGALNGEMREWSADGKIVSQQTYVDGRLREQTIGWYAPGQKEFEGYYLRVPNMPQTNYDWWTSTAIAGKLPTGNDQRHGDWTSWYRNGNKKAQWQYDHDAPIGKFTWWYENGQKQAEGEYQGGVQTGTWATWHRNGLKESEAVFKEGKLVDKSTQWDADGRLIEARAATTATPAAATTPQATRPVPISTSGRFGARTWGR